MDAFLLPADGGGISPSLLPRAELVRRGVRLAGVGIEDMPPLVRLFRAAGVGIELPEPE